MSHAGFLYLLCIGAIQKFNTRILVPTFPEFKDLEWSDKENVERITSQFLPYSDFNFTSLWCWNTQEKTKLSLLNENLVVLFLDYITEQPFLSFIGENKVNETASMLIEYSSQNFKTPYLKLIPEKIVRLLSHDFTVTPDEGAYDYIIPVSYLATLTEYPGISHHAARDCKYFLKYFPNHESRILTFNEVDCLSQTFMSWCGNKNLNHAELNEYKAFERLVNNKDAENIIHSLFIGDDMVGFEISEIVSMNYAVTHFMKANNKYKGIYDAMMLFLGRNLAEKKVRYLNIEQDLGIPNLRNAKRKYKPPFYLKKFIIEKRYVNNT